MPLAAACRAVDAICRHVLRGARRGFRYAQRYARGAFAQRAARAREQQQRRVLLLQRADIDAMRT